MCRSRRLGGRRCTACADPSNRRAYARAKYAATALTADPAPRTQPLSPGLPDSRTAVTADWGDRGDEIADLLDVVPTLEDLTALHVAGGDYSLTRIRTRPETERTPAERLALKAAALYEAEFPGRTDGSTAAFRADKVTVGPDGIRISGPFLEVSPTGAAFPGGDFARTLLPPSEPGGLWGAKHDRLILKNKYQGHGLGTRMARRGENALIAAGIHHVDIDAADKMGGYAWAKAGYGWQPGAEPVTGNKKGNVRPRMVKFRTEHGDPDGQIAAMLARLDDRSDPGTYPTPQDVAMLGWTPGAAMWPGREIMTGAWWIGRKTLTPPLRALAAA